MQNMIFFIISLFKIFTAFLHLCVRNSELLLWNFQLVSNIKITQKYVGTLHRNLLFQLDLSWYLPNCFFIYNINKNYKTVKLFLTYFQRIFQNWSFKMLKSLWNWLKVWNVTISCYRLNSIQIFEELFEKIVSRIYMLTSFLFFDTWQKQVTITATDVTTFYIQILLI